MYIPSNPVHQEGAWFVGMPSLLDKLAIARVTDRHARKAQSWAALPTLWVVGLATYVALGVGLYPLIGRLVVFYWALAGLLVLFGLIVVTEDEVSGRGSYNLLGEDTLSHLDKLACRRLRRRSLAGRIVPLGKSPVLEAITSTPRPPKQQAWLESNGHLKPEIDQVLRSPFINDCVQAINILEDSDPNPEDWLRMEAIKREVREQIQPLCEDRQRTRGANLR